MELPAAATDGDDDAPPSRLIWLFFVAIGASSVIAGALALVFPDITLTAISVILGVELLLLGGLELVEAVTDEDATTTAMEIALALVAIVAGVVVLRRPSETLLVVLLAAGVYFIVAGLVLVLRAVVNVDKRGPRAVGGAALLVVGIVIVAWPDLGLGAVAAVAGIGLIVRGTVALVTAHLVGLVRHATVSPA